MSARDDPHVDHALFCSHHARAAGYALSLSVATACFGAGCVSASVGDEGSGGSARGDTSPATSSSEDAGQGPSGIECGEDPDYGVVLCRGVETCPSLRVSGDGLEGCGFRKGDGVFTLDCVCAEALCPIGTPLTCEEAAALLVDTDRFTVCAQVSDGSCQALAPKKPEAAPSNCDAACMSSCGASQACRDLCGC